MSINQNEKHAQRACPNKIMALPVVAPLPMYQRSMQCREDIISVNNELHDLYGNDSFFVGFVL